ELLESFHKAQSNYALATGLAAVSEIAELVLPEREVSEPMFRLILLAAREIERTAEWTLPLSYFAFWTVRLGGWLPRFDRCSFARSAVTRGCGRCIWRRGGWRSALQASGSIGSENLRLRLQQIGNCAKPRSIGSSTIRIASCTHANFWRPLEI